MSAAERALATLLEHEAPAVGLDEPALFAGHARWLADLLRPRGVGTEEVVRSFQMMRDAASGRMPAEQAEVVARCVAAGVEALQGPAGAGACRSGPTPSPPSWPATGDAR